MEKDEEARVAKEARIVAVNNVIWADCEENRTALVEVLKDKSLLYWAERDIQTDWTIDPEIGQVSFITAKGKRVVVTNTGDFIRGE